MKNLRERRPALVATLFALAALLAVSATSFAQGRGHGYGRGRGRGADLSWKCGKFVNCHDARNGRLDNRGPRGVRVGRRFRNDDLLLRNRRVRRNDRGVIFVPRNRVRIDRDLERNEIFRERGQNRVDGLEQRGVMRRGRGRP